MSANILDLQAKSVWSPKVAGIVTLLLVFLCGAAIGAVVMDLGVHNRHRSGLDSLNGNAASFQRIQKDLDLTPAQAEQVESILTDSWQYYVTVLSDSKQRIEQILTPEQRLKFERLLEQATKK
jgi:Spy/CpxP family protein refolding chaperone